MGLKKWALIAEIVGAAAVVMSLLYVGLELRGNSRSIRLGNQQAAVALGIEADAWLSNSEFADTYEAGLRDLSSLTEAQKIQVDSFVGQHLNVWEFAFYSRESGLIEDALWEGWDRWGRSQIRQESWRLLWETSKREAYGVEFQAHVDAILATE